MTPEPTFPALRANEYRDAWCGQVLPDRVGETVRVAGWVHRRRDHGGLIFIDLRDRTGLVQLVFNPDTAGGAFELGHEIRAEDVLTASGEVVRRSEETINPELPTGEVEVRVTDADRLADADTPPFEIESFSGEVGEEARLRYRYLDLRRDRMHGAIELRHRVVRAIREFFDGEGFVDIETPMLSRSTPEGARDFLVPSRREPGSFYALPQSPQLFKQLLMIGGFERYYQIARCFRDEDTRADRQPEFTQLDLEMSFVEEDDVIEVMEAVMGAVFEREGFAVAPPPWPRMTFAEAVSRYGIDRPDTRFALELHDLGDGLGATEFQVFAGALGDGGVVRGINAGRREVPRSELEELTELAKQHGAKGLVWAFVQEGDEAWRSPLAKFLKPEEITAINSRLAASPGDLLLIVADEVTTAGQALSALRLELGRRFGLIDESRHDILWVVEFPAFLWNAEEQRWDSPHHPFTAPTGDLDDPAGLGSRAYDLVLDGSEIGGGSIRIHRREVQERVFELLGIGPEEAQARFGFLLDALRYGAPPHGGIAMGIDRIVTALAGRETIRDVIAFPKAASGADPLTGAPAPVDPVQLRELGLRRL
jgi:aspartyl-tRNA synthetase